jgi:hypothetical protein
MLSVYSRHYPPCPSDDINYKRCGSVWGVNTFSVMTVIPCA